MENTTMVKQASDQGLRWFQDIRFGMFIHWGPTAVHPYNDWVMHAERVPPAEYEKIAARLNPTKFNADEWVSIAADAGQKYIVFTTKHHDGFSMYDTALSDYKITTFTPFKRDPLRELVNACTKRGDVKMGFYNSLLDWHHPAYRFRKESGLAWSDYIDFLHGQVRELCTNYGDIACMWFDGDWPNHVYDETDSYFLPPEGESYEYDKLYDMIHTLQPDAVIINNRHENPLPGEDVQGFEQDLPGLNTTGFNSLTISNHPLEVCMTINDHWFHIAGSINYKSTKQLISNLVRSASAGANYLLNVGPLETGEIVPQHAQRLRGVGEWLKTNGESIYGTRAGVIVPSADVVSTRKGNTHYVHLLGYKSDTHKLTGVPENIKQAHLLNGGAAIEFQRQDGTFVLTVPQEQRDPFDTVVVLS
jgi:alpha-L-fucosidase